MTDHSGSSLLVISDPPPIPVPSPAGKAGRLGRRLDRGPQAGPWRVLSVLLLIVGCVLAPIGVTANWAKNLLVDQEAYLQAVGPLITDHVIITAVEDKLVAAINNAASNLPAGDAAGGRAGRGLPPKLGPLAIGGSASMASGITTMVHTLLASPELVTIWNDANALAHREFVDLMEGQATGNPPSITIDLSSAISELNQELASASGGRAPGIPDVPVVFTIAENSNIQQLVGYYQLVKIVGGWLPGFAALLLLLSIVIAPRRSAGLLRAALGVLLSMVTLTLALVAARQLLETKAPLPSEVTEAITRQFTVNLRGTVWLIVVGAAVVAVIAWLVRRANHGVGADAADRVPPGSQRQQVIRIAAGVIGLALVLVLVSLVSPGPVLAVALTVLAGLATVIASVRRSGRTPVS